MTSKIKVDNINKVSDDSNIINKCGTNITMGQNGDTVIIPNGVTEQVQSGGVIQVQSGGSITIASGATITNSGTQTGFGREGTVNWQTTPKTAASFTAVSGEGYFCDTSGNTITVNLPAGSAGAIVSLADYTRTWQTNGVIVSPDGTEKIGGINADANLNTEGQSVTFVYVDATEGWINVQDSTSAVQGRVVTPYIVATVTGACNTLTESGDDKIATFLGPGSLCVTNEGIGSNQVVSHMVIAGGGGGGHDDGGGGGAGGYRENESPVTPYTASPIKGGTAVTISSVGAIPVTVGGGGPGGIPGGANCGVAQTGSDSIFDSITSAGGGFGDRGQPSGGPGGSGGGGDSGSSGGTGNDPATSPSQGNPGGSGGTGNSGGGGGGAGATGSNGVGSAPTSSGGNGGAGVTTEINASSVTRAGGGGGGAFGSAGSGGPGGGGNGATYPNSQATNGADNTGGGGGGGSTSTGPRDGKNGGSGIVIIRYKFQN